MGGPMSPPATTIDLEYEVGQMYKSDARAASLGWIVPVLKRGDEGDRSEHECAAPRDSYFSNQLPLAGHAGRATWVRVTSCDDGHRAPHG